MRACNYHYLFIAIFAFWDDIKRSEAAAEEKKQQSEAAEKLTIEIPDPCKKGTILIKANGGVYGFYGDIDIENDGKNGEQIEITLDGFIVDTYPHGENNEPQIYGP